MKFWNNFAEKHPKAAEWIREGGLFVIVSNLITLFKYLILTFLPYAFLSLGTNSYVWPGTKLTVFGQEFIWTIIGAPEVEKGIGGMAYFAAYCVAMVIGECINFPIQKLLVFRSHGNTGKQIAWYTAAFIFINVIVLSINGFWQQVMGQFVPPAVYNIGTIVLNGGISMVVFFFVNKIIFPQTPKEAVAETDTATETEE